MQIEVRAALDQVTLESIEATVRSQKTLEDVVRWGLLTKPPRLVADIIVQDEYTHDVVMPFRDGIYLVYDTT
jgi:hypothetical protein